MTGLGELAIEDDDKDGDLATSWYLKAAERGNATAMCWLGDQAEVVRDDEAQGWYERAAGLRDPEAMSWLGQAAERKGEYGQARSWYLESRNTASKPPMDSSRSLIPDESPGLLLMAAFPPGSPRRRPRYSITHRTVSTAILSPDTQPPSNRPVGHPRIPGYGTSASVHCIDLAVVQSLLDRPLSGTPVGVAKFRPLSDRSCSRSGRVRQRGLFNSWSAPLA